jgi:large subunit ribosomal protein L5
MNRYADFYSDSIRLILLTKYNYKNVKELENIDRIDLSLRVKNSKHIVSSLAALELLSLKGFRSFSQRKSSNYKSQKENLLLTSSIKGSDIFYFIENLLNNYLPRIRYFKGLPLQNFSNKGIFTFQFKDLLIFPELEEELETFYMLSNLNLSIVIDKNKDKNPFFLSLFNFPFQQI